MSDPRGALSHGCTLQFATELAGSAPGMDTATRMAPLTRPGARLPSGWPLWVDDQSQHPAYVFPQRQTPPEHPQKAWYTRWWAIAGAAILGLIVIAGVTRGGSTEAPESAAATGATQAQDATTSLAPSTTSAAPPPTTTQAPPPTTTQAPPPPTTPEPPPLSPGQRNALGSAQDYLDFTAFSRQGLIDQLKYEGYSEADATWAVDQVTVDWNQQAVLMAEDYLDFTSFSRQGLVDQLVYSGFTPAEAEYGASQAYDG